MKIKRFQAEDVRTTIRKVRETLGPDAVILSNKRINGGVEIVAAIDYDESLMGGIVAEPHVDARTQNSERTTYQTQTTSASDPSVRQKSATASNQRQAALRKSAADDVRYSRNIPATTRSSKIPTAEIDSSN